MLGFLDVQYNLALAWKQHLQYLVLALLAASELGAGFWFACATMSNTNAFDANSPPRSLCHQNSVQDSETSTIVTQSSCDLVKRSHGGKTFQSNGCFESSPFLIGSAPLKMQMEFRMEVFPNPPASWVQRIGYHRLKWDSSNWCNKELYVLWMHRAQIGAPRHHATD